MNCEENDGSDGLSETHSGDINTCLNYKSISNVSIYHNCLNVTPSDKRIHFGSPLGCDNAADITIFHSCNTSNNSVENSIDGDSSSKLIPNSSQLNAIAGSNNCDKCIASNTNGTANTDSIQNGDDKKSKVLLSSFGVSNGAGVKSIKKEDVSSNLATIELKIKNPKKNIALNSAIASKSSNASRSIFASKSNLLFVKSKLNLQITQAKRIHFLRYGNKFHTGITLPVSKVKYKAFESLLEDVTRLLCCTLKLPGPIRAIYTKNGENIISIEEFDPTQSYICCCKNETTKKETINDGPQNKAPGRISLCQTQRPTRYLRLDIKREGCVRPRVIILIKYGPKPRKIFQLLLNKDNNQSFGKIKQTITVALKMNSGSIQKIFTLWGFAIRKLEEFFGDEDIFLVHSNEYVYYPDNFELDGAEIQKLEEICQKSQNIGKLYQVLEAETSQTVEKEFDIPEILHDRYKIEDKIGEGHFAVVMKIISRRTKKTFALKIVDKYKYDDVEEVMDSEINVLRTLNHPHVISLLTVINRPKKFYLVTDYMAGGDVHDVLSKSKQFSEPQCRLIVKQLVLALNYLQTLHIVHRDVKVENLLALCDESGYIKNVKLADFGLAVQTKKQLFVLCGTPLYMAPEMLSMDGYGKEIDVWATGVVLYYMVFKAAPFDDDDEQLLHEKISVGEFCYPETEVSADCKNLIENLLQIDPRTRFTCDKILNHNWMKGKTFEH
ncbi:serine/threonine-protein kinase GL21140-like [Teleopsis dalmanni]|uniref:serine/threonine-protein kinase GL21140-like n=1 Tax=Teleopsis dalmanni TaxID=139649 RepID=UPI0018CFE870|nr:serine/threonine-protein kinase GL21140-like [Teleopsis dalmanni]